MFDEYYIFSHFSSKLFRKSSLFNFVLIVTFLNQMLTELMQVYFFHSHINKQRCLTNCLPTHSQIKTHNQIKPETKTQRIKQKHLAQCKFRFTYANPNMFTPFIHIEFLNKAIGKQIKPVRRTQRQTRKLQIRYGKINRYRCGGEWLW